MPRSCRNSTLLVNNYNSFTNNGAGVTWIPFDMPGTAYQASVSEIDPTTGLPRLIFGNSQGIWSVLDDNGTFETTIGGYLSTPGINRNGNLQLTQFYDGAAQPSMRPRRSPGPCSTGPPRTTADPFSTANILTTGDLQWSVPPGDISSNLDSSAVTLDQQGLGTVVVFWFPGTPTSGTTYSDFLTVNGVGSTYGLLQAVPRVSRQPTRNGRSTRSPTWSRTPSTVTTW